MGILENFKEGKTSIGAYTSDHEMIRLMAHIGFDWVMIDQMFTGNDWSKTESLVTTAEAANITPVVRVQSNPWVGYDHRIAVDVTRAQGIGAQFIFVSPSNKKEIEECLEVSKDWHKRALTIHPFDNFDWEPTISKMSNEAYVIPTAESKGSLDELETIMGLPGLKGFFLSMTDASRVITGKEKPDWYNPKLWNYLEKAVKIGNDKGIIVGANTSYAYDMEEMEKRVKKLHDAGIKLILIQGATFLFQIAIGKFVRSIKGYMKE